MTYKEFLCCLAVIYHGSQRERMQRKFSNAPPNNSVSLSWFDLVLYAILSTAGTLRWGDAEQFLQQCGDQLSNELKNFFPRDEFVTQEKFLQWLTYHQGHTTSTIDWLMDEQRLHELTTYSIERIYDKYSILAGVTHCT